MRRKLRTAPMIPGLRPYSVDGQVMSRAEKDSVRMVMELWQEYVSSFTSPQVSARDRRAMWMDGSPDYLEEFGDGNLLYATFRETRVLDIRKLNAGTYEISVLTRSKLPADYADWVESVYRLCAMAVAKPSAKVSGQQNPFRLCNWLDAVLPTLLRQDTPQIAYYSTAGVPRADARHVSKFVEAFRDTYGLPSETPLRYVVGTSVEECRQWSGFLFNAYFNPLMASVSAKDNSRSFFGKAYPSGIVLSNYRDDTHDIVLSLVRSARPEALPLVVDGMAHYHGGYMTFSYETLKASLRIYLTKHRDLDLSVEDNLYDRYVPVLDGISVPLEQLIGAVIVEEAFTRHGAWKVRELLECRGYSRLFPCLGVPVKGIDKWIRTILQENIFT